MDKFILKLTKLAKLDMHYFLSANFWLFISRGFVSGSGFLLTVAFANLLSENDFGTYKYILSVFGMLTAFTLTGLIPTTLKLLAKKDNNSIFPIIDFSKKFSLPGAALAILIGLYYFLQENHVLGVCIMFSSLNIYFSWLSINKTLFLSTGDFKSLAYFSMLRSILPTIIMLIVIVFTQNLIIIVLSFFTSQIIFGYFTFKASLKKLSFNNQSTSNISELKSFSVHASLASGIQIISQYIDHFIIWHFLGPIQLATYAIAQGPTKELRVVLDNFATSFLPKIMGKSLEEYNKDRNLIKRAFQLFLLILTLCLMISFFMPIIYQLFFPKYLEAIPYSILILFTAILLPRNLFVYFNLTHGNTKQYYFLNSTPGIVLIILYLLLIPLYGIYGAILALFLSELYSLTTNYFVYKHLSNASINKKSVT